MTHIYAHHVHIVIHKLTHPYTTQEGQGIVGLGW